MTLSWRNIHGALRAFAVSTCMAMIAGSPSLAQETPAMPTPGQWTVDCGAPVAGAPEICRMTQILLDPENQRPIFDFTIFYPPGQSGAPTALIRVPLGVLLPAGLLLQVDDGRTGNAPFSVCDPNGCLSQFQMEPQQITEMKAGNTMKIGFRRADGQGVQLPVTLIGFTAAFNQISPG